MLRAFLCAAPAVLCGVGALAAPIAPYAGEQARSIKALSEEQIAELQSGKGMGLAKAAELNGYPGPLHVIENADALALSEEQLLRSQEIFDEMKLHAVQIGKDLLEAERVLDELFNSHQAERESLARALGRIGKLQTRLRGIHLQAHVDQVALLDPAQLEKYAQLRGYSANAQHGASQTLSHH